MYRQQEPSNYDASPSRVTKDEIENMSDQELASLIRQQRVQVERFGVGLVHAIENETPPPSPLSPAPKPTPPQQSSTPTARPKDTERPTERRENRRTAETETYPVSPSATDNQQKLPVGVDYSELIQLRNQLAQSLGRENELRELLRNASSSGQGQQTGEVFNEAVVECIEDLNNELEVMAKEREFEEYGNYESAMYQTLLSDVDQLILQARRANSPAKRLHETANLSLMSPSRRQQHIIVQPPSLFQQHIMVQPPPPLVPPAASSLAAPLPLSRGLQALSENPPAAAASFLVPSVHETFGGIFNQSRTQRTVALMVRQSPPPSSDFIRIPSLGMDASGNITVS
jgi:hypothetical protein